MNKMIIIILSFVLLLALNVAPVMAAMTTDTQLIANANVGAPTLSKAFTDAMKVDRYYIRYTFISDVDGTRSEGITGANGKNGAFEMISSKMDVRTKMLVKNDKAYSIDHNTKTYSVIPSKKNPHATPMYAELRFIGSGTDNIDGKMLPYEEYALSDRTMRFYVEGIRLFAIESKINVVIGNNKSVKTSIMLIHEFSTRIPKGFLDIPQGYRQIDLETW